MNNKALKNLRDLINNSEAVHNKYVDDKVSEVSELISKNDTGIVSLKRDTDSYLHLDNNMYLKCSYALRCI